MTIHASANKTCWPRARGARAPFCPPSVPPRAPNHGPVAGSYWNSISDPDLTPVSCVVSCPERVWCVRCPPKILVVRDPPRPVSQSNIATRLCPPTKDRCSGLKLALRACPGKLWIGAGDEEPARLLEPDEPFAQDRQATPQTKFRHHVSRSLVCHTRGPRVICPPRKEPRARGSPPYPLPLTGPGIDTRTRR